MRRASLLIKKYFLFPFFHALFSFFPQHPLPSPPYSSFHNIYPWTNKSWDVGSTLKNIICIIFTRGGPDKSLDTGWIIILCGDAKRIIFFTSGRFFKPYLWWIRVDLGNDYVSSFYISSNLLSCESNWRSTQSFVYLSFLSTMKLKAPRLRTF